MDDIQTVGHQLLGKLLSETRTKHIPGGQIIAHEGDMPHEVFILKHGVVQIYDIDDSGNEKILHLVKPPTLVPFAFFSGFRQPLRWFYAALTDCDVCVIEFSKLKAMTYREPALGEVLTNGFSDNVHELLVRLSSLGKSNTQDKVVAALKFLAVNHATQRRSGWYRLNFPMSHQLIANICGITRESTAIVMKDLQLTGCVRYPKSTILEIRLEHLAG